MRKKVIMVVVLAALCCSVIGCSKGKALASKEDRVENLENDLKNDDDGEENKEDTSLGEESKQEDKKEDTKEQNNNKNVTNNNVSKSGMTDTGKYDTTYVVSANGDYSGVDNVKGKYTSVSKAVDEAKEGTIIYVKSGTYYENIDFKKSGTEEKPIKIMGFGENGKRPVIDGSKINKSGTPPIIGIKDQSNIKIDGIEICNYEVSNSSVPVGIAIRGKSSNIYIHNCDVHDIKVTYGKSDSVNGHGIIVSGDNSSTPINNVNILNNNVHNLRLGQSESVVVNGNVTNAKVNYNEIHDNDNIGIDFIGYEGVCGNSANDRARNCECIGNKVYNISAKTNKTYDSPCADGIYVDGGKDILIKNNVVNNSDIGIEAASEHKNKATENITIENNLVYNCKGYAGICFGGSSESNGTATGIKIKNNTVYNNNVDLVIQQANSDTNVVENNIFARKDKEANFEAEGSISKNNKNVIKDNVFTSSEEFTSSMKSSNIVTNVTFKDVANGDFTVTDSKYAKYGYQKQ